MIRVLTRIRSGLTLSCPTVVRTELHRDGEVWTSSVPDLLTVATCMLLLLMTSTLELLVVGARAVVGAVGGRWLVLLLVPRSPTLIDLMFGMMVLTDVLRREFEFELSLLLKTLERPLVRLPVPMPPMQQMQSREFVLPLFWLRCVTYLFMCLRQLGRGATMRTEPACLTGRNWNTLVSGARLVLLKTPLRLGSIAPILICLSGNTLTDTLWS